MKNTRILVVALLVGAGALFALWHMVLKKPPVGRNLGLQLNWQSRIARVGAERAYDEFVRSVQNENMYAQHLDAHIFGDALFIENGLSYIALCDEQYASGCFHELFLRTVTQGGLSSVSQIEHACAELSEDIHLRCDRQIGHSLVVYMGYQPNDLKSALDLCTALLPAQDAPNCSQGVHEEFTTRTIITAETPPSSGRLP